MDNERLPAALSMLKWRSQQLVARLFALPLVVIVALLTLAGSSLFIGSFHARRGLRALCSGLQVLLAWLVVIVSWPISMLLTLVGTLGQSLKAASAHMEDLVVRIIDAPGAVAPVVIRKRRQEAAAEVVAQGRMLARQQMLERAAETAKRDRAGGGRASAQPPAAKPLTPDEISELRARQKPITFGGGGPSATNAAAGARPPSVTTSVPRDPGGQTINAAGGGAPATDTLPPSRLSAVTYKDAAAAPPAVATPSRDGKGPSAAGDPTAEEDPAMPATVGTKKSGTNKWLWRGATAPLPPTEPKK